MRNLAGIFVYVACLCTSGSAYLITVDAHAEECFFDKVDAGTRLSLLYKIAEGDFLDIDVRIVGPDNEIIYRVHRRTSGKSTFTAYKPGMYTYCFSNKMSMTTPKVVMFNMDIREPPKTEEWSTGTEADSKRKLEAWLEDMIGELSDTLTDVKHEQEFMHGRDRIHRALDDSIISNVAVCSLFEVLILVTMTFSQVYYLRRLFEVERDA